MTKMTDVTKENITDEELKATRTFIMELLHENVLKINFTKKDGTTREMRCTLQADLLPEVKVTEGKEGATHKRQKNYNIVPVWDLDNDGWRSIRVASIIDVEF